MYDKYFGLTAKPFSIAPDPRYLFMSEQHREALAHLVYGVGDGGGFVLLTGEVGTGKTTVCRCLLQQIPENTRIAFILNPKLSTTELLATVCDELHIDYPENPSLKQLNDQLNTFLLSAHATGLKIVLMIDEAQNLSSEVLEQIRLLTNLETNKEKLLQIILIGQPELKELLAQYELRQLAQRITARFHLRPLNADECESYILHRLEVSGFNDSLFDKKAIKELFRLSGGVPRLINVLCDRAMLGAYARNRRQIGAKVIKQAANEVMGSVESTQADHPLLVPDNSWRLMASSLAIILVLGGGFALYWFQKQFVEPEALIIQQSTQLEQMNEENQQLRNTIKSMQEVKAEIAKPLLPFLPAEIRPTSQLQAQQQLLQRWHIEYQPETDGDVCDFAKVNQLRCETASGDWALLAMLNRPVILKLFTQAGQAIYGVLIALDGQKVRINFSGKELLLSRKLISEYWQGDYSFLWQAPPNYQQPLSVSMRGTPVQWLLTSLAKLENLDLIVPPNAVYDLELKIRVEKFQQQHSLRADGIAGPHTFITLNSLTDLNTPTLSALGSAS